MSQTEQADHSTVSSAGLEVATHLVVPPGFLHFQCPAPRHRDNCKDIVSCGTIVQNRGIFAVLPEEVPDLLDYFFPRTVFNLI